MYIPDEFQPAGRKVDPWLKQIDWLVLILPGDWGLKTLNCDYLPKVYSIFG